MLGMHEEDPAVVARPGLPWPRWSGASRCTLP